MKSILAALPILGFAVAQEHCSKQPIVTVTDTETYTVTVAPVTAAEIEAPPVTLTVDITETHTVYVTSSASSSVPLAPYYPFPNGTHKAPHPSTFVSISLVYVTPVPITSKAEGAYSSDFVASVLPTSKAPADITTSDAPAAQPTSQVPAAAEPVTSPDAITAALTGEATYYGGNVAGGMCSFTGYTIPSNLFGTALSDANWASAESCGACVSIKGPSGNSITAMVVDQCPGCGNNHLDLFPDAFAKLANPTKGVIPVSWSFVPCGITSPIILKNKSGTSKYWFSMQVMNANVRVSKLEVSTDRGNTWKATTRQPYNFFENPSGFGTDSVDVRVTSVDGKSIVVKSVSIAADSTKTASGNF